MSRINMVMFQGKIFKVEEKPVPGKKCAEIKMRQSYPKAPSRKLDNPTAEDFHTDWITVTCWGDTATIALELQANDYVCVQGRLRYEEWQNKEGEKRSKHVIVANYLHRTPGQYKDTVSNTLATSVASESDVSDDPPF